MIKRRIYLSLLAFLVGLLCILCGILVLQGTEWGTKASLNLISSRVEGLAIQYRQGTLFKELTLNQLSFKQEGIQAELENVAIDININCLWRKAICINSFSAESFDFSSSTTQQASPEPEKSLAGILSDLPTLSIPVALQIDSLEITNANLSFSGSNYKLSELSLAALWKNESLQIQHLSLNVEDQASLKLKGELELNNSYPLNIQLDTNIQQFPQWPSLNGAQIQTQLEGNLQQLEFTVSSEGPLVMQASGETQLTVEDTPFSLTLNASQLPLPENYLEQGQVSSLVFNANGNVQQQQFDLEAIISGFSYNNAVLTAQAVHRQQELSLETLTFNDPQSQSEALINGIVNYQQGLAWQTSIALNNFVLPELLPAHGQFSGQANSQGKLENGQWEITLSETNIEGQLNDLPARLSGDFSLNHLWQMPASNLHLELNDTVLEIQGYTDEQWHVAGSLSANSLTQWNVGIDGQGEIQFQISGDSKDPVVNFDGEINSLFWQDLLIPELLLNGRYQPENNQQLALTLIANQMSQKDYKIEALELSLDGNLDQYQLALLSTGDLNSNIKLNGAWLPEDNSWQGEILENSLIGFSDFEWQLQNTINLNLAMADSEIALSAHCWQGQQNSFCLRQDAILGSQGHLEIDLNANLSFLDELILPPQLQLETRLDGSLDLSWSENSPTHVNAEFTIEPGQLFVSGTKNPLEILSWQEGAIKVTADSDTAKLNFTLQEQDLSLLDIELSLTEQFEKIAGEVHLSEFTLQPLAAFIDEIRELEGSLFGDIVISGDTSAPQASGNFQIQQARLLLFASPAPIEAITLDLNFAGQKAELRGEFYIGDDPGNISGQANWEEQFSLDLNLNAEQLDIIYPPQLIASIKPTLSMSLQPEKLVFNGQVEVLSGTLTLEELAEGSVSPSQDQVFINDDFQVINQQGQFDIESDIFISIDPVFELEADGFSGHLAGRMQLVHKQDLLQLFGSLQIPDGRYTAYGQNLEVERGSLSFNGPVTNPQIELRAFREIPRENIVVGVQIQGQSDNPDISLFSDPTMEESEILSYLMRGRGLDAAVGGSAIINLALSATKAGTSGLLQELENASGISDIEINTEGDGDDTQATISGYFGNRLYLKYGVGVYEPINELTVRLYFLNRLWLETVSGIEDSSADLYYSFEID